MNINFGPAYWTVLLFSGVIGGTSLWGGESHSPAAARNTFLYSHGDPTAEEQLFLEYVNRARMDPAAEGIRLANSTDPDVQQIYTDFNVDLDQLKADFASYPVRAPMAFHPSLIQATRRHSQDMSDNDFQNFTGTDGSTIDSRAADAGYDKDTLTGGIFSFANSVFHGYAAFIIDANNVNLGNRDNILNFSTQGFWYEYGIGIVRDTNEQTNVGPLVITQNFAQDFDRTAFVVGVIYQDTNGNGFYDIGEGVSGVSVTLDQGSFCATTSASGGYAIPIEGLTGPLTVMASGGPLSSTLQQTVTLTGTSVKVDFVPTPAALQLPVINSGPTATPDPTELGDPTSFSVDATDPAAGTLTYSWDFGDGTTGSGPNPTHTYASKGTFMVNLDITGAGGTISSNVSVTVQRTAFPLTLTKAKALLKFGSASLDRLKFQATLSFPQDITLANQSIDFLFSGINHSVTLNSKEKSLPALAKIKFKIKGHKKGNLISAGTTATIIVSSSGAYTSKFSLGGVAKLNESTTDRSGRSASVNCELTIGNLFFEFKNVDGVWKAIENKRGTFTFPVKKTPTFSNPISPTGPGSGGISL